MPGRFLCRLLKRKTDCLRRIRVYKTFLENRNPVCKKKADRSRCLQACISGKDLQTGLEQGAVVVEAELRKAFFIIPDQLI